MANSDDKPAPMVLDASFLTPLDTNDDEDEPKEKAPPASLGLPGQVAPAAPKATPLPPLPGQAAPAPSSPKATSLPPLPGQAAPSPAPPATSLPPLPGQAAPAPSPPKATPSAAPPPAPVIVPAPPPQASTPPPPVIVPVPVDTTPTEPKESPPPAVSAAAPKAEPVAAAEPSSADAASPNAASPLKGADGKKHPAEGLKPLDVTKYIPEKFRKHVDGNSPPPVRMMGARAMVPMGPKDMVHVLYAGIFDPEPKIAALARKSFKGLDDRLLGGLLGDATVASPVLGYLAKVHVNDEAKMEKLLLNRATPDAAFSYAAENAEHASTLGMVAGNQERTLRCHDIIRGLRKNPKALRSDLDRAIDFLVREGVFLEDVPEFEDSFVRLGKSEMLEVLKKVEMPDEVLTPEQKAAAAKLGATPEDFILGNIPDVDILEKEVGLAEEQKRVPFNKLSIPMQLKAAMLGSHEQALEALKSNNRMVAVAGIRSPKIKDADIPKIVRSKSMHEDVIRYICNNGDWTKSYGVKHGLVQHPKTPMSLVLRWLPLMRKQDLKALSKSKQIPSAVSVQAKRLLSTRGG